MGIFLITRVWIEDLMDLNVKYLAGKTSLKLCYVIYVIFTIFCKNVEFSILTLPLLHCVAQVSRTVLSAAL